MQFHSEAAFDTRSAITSSTPLTPARASTVARSSSLDQVVATVRPTPQPASARIRWYERVRMRVGVYGTTKSAAQWYTWSHARYTVRQS